MSYWFLRGPHLVLVGASCMGKPKPQVVRKRRVILTDEERRRKRREYMRPYMRAYTARKRAEAEGKT